MMYTIVCGRGDSTVELSARDSGWDDGGGAGVRALALCVGSGNVIGDEWVRHPLTRFVSFTGSREVGLRINELAAKPRSEG